MEPVLEQRFDSLQSFKSRQGGLKGSCTVAEKATIRPVDFLSIVFERETLIPVRLRIRATPVRAPGPAETRPSNFRRVIQVGVRSEYVDGKHVR